MIDQIVPRRPHWSTFSDNCVKTSTWHYIRLVQIPHSPICYQKENSTHCNCMGDTLFHRSTSSMSSSQIQRLFSHENKVRNLNFNSKCAFWIKIRKTVFWTVCMPNYIAMHHLKCAFQMMVQMCFPVTHLANHANEITVWMPWPLNCDLGGGAKSPSNHFRLYTACCIMHVQKHRKCELRACLIGREPRHSSPTLEC